jgi:hypothetical protein
MTWNEVGSWTITDYQTWLPVSFTSRLIIKVSNIAGLKPTWNWSGYFYQYLDIPPIGLTRINEKINVLTQDSILFVPEIFKPNYALKFIKADWIPSLILTIYEDSMPLIFEPVVNIPAAPSTIANAVNTATIPISATSISLLAANPNRKKLIISNNTNQDLFIDFDSTAAIVDHAIKIPKITNSGFIANYELEQYTGIVSGVWTANGTGAALIRELV